MKTEIYCVVGVATNVGKTTTTCALMNTLSKRGKKVIAFKPFAGSRLRDLIDFAFEEYPKNPNKVFGNDGLKLCRASKLTTDKDVDLVSPWQLIFNISSQDTLLIRTGSSELGNTKYYKSPEFEQLLLRKDISRLIKLLKLPVDEATIFNQNIHSRSTLDNSVQSKAFHALLNRNPDVVVLEGAGPYLPTWKGMPIVDHLLILDYNQMTLIPNVHLNFEYNGKPRSIKELFVFLNSSKHTKKNLKTYSTHQYFCEKEQRLDLLSNELELLLTSAKI